MRYDWADNDEAPPTALVEELLPGLHGVSWGELTHAYGSAHDVPRELVGLLTDDQARADEAAERLASALVHQGSLYPASGPALPLLLGLARQRALGPGREHALTLATSMVEAALETASSGQPNAKVEEVLAHVPALRALLRELQENSDPLASLARIAEAILDEAEPST